MPSTVDRTLRSQIDAYIAAGKHRVIPTNDARILPEKPKLDWASLGANAPAPKVRDALRASAEASRPRPTARSADGWPDDSLRITHVGKCAAVPGSKRDTRYKLWSLNETVEHHRKKGVRLSDLRRDQAAGRIIISGDSPGDEPVPEAADVPTEGSGAAEGDE